MPWWSQKEQDDEKKMGEKKQLKTIFDTFDSMVFIWIQDVLLTMKTFVLLIHHSNVVLVLLSYFFGEKKSQPPKVHFYSISKQMILPPWSSPANPSSSEGTCPKLQRRHTRTQHVDEEEEDRKQRKSSLSSPLPGHSLLHLHLPTSGRSSTFSGKTLGLSLAPATTPFWNFGLYTTAFFILMNYYFVRIFVERYTYLCTYLKTFSLAFR